MPHRLVRHFFMKYFLLYKSTQSCEFSSMSSECLRQGCWDLPELLYESRPCVRNEERVPTARPGAQ